MNYRVFDTAEIDHQQIYRLLIGSVVPRPIAWVSTMSAAGVANLAPFSFFTMVSHHPPMASISVGERENKPKDTARNILDTKGLRHPHGGERLGGVDERLRGQLRAR